MYSDCLGLVLKIWLHLIFSVGHLKKNFVMVKIVIYQKRQAPEAELI